MLSDEMKIGNIFKPEWNEDYFILTAKSILEQFQCDIAKREYFKPIKINDEWLKLLGFKCIYESEYQKQFEKEYIEDKPFVSVKHKLHTDSYSFYFGGLVHKIEFIHELQNLHYELKKEKLTL